MRVGFFGAFDPTYPRTVVLREGLESQGADVRLIAVAASATPVAREVRLALRWMGAGGGFDALIVPSFGHHDMPLAALLGRISGTPVIFDPLVSRWDTQVGDLGRIRRGSISEKRLRASDHLALSLGDLVLCDTWEHGDFYAAEYGVPRSKLFRVPVGADRSAFSKGETPFARAGGGALKVVYVGGFLPLHGVEIIIDAATILESHRGPGFARFTLIGDGTTAWRSDRDIAARGLRSVRRLPRISYRDALDELARADLALGVFGTTAKAGRVVPHKLYQAMALGVPTVTRRSRAIAEFFREGEHAILVPPGDPAALARVIEDLAGDAARLGRIGAAGRSAAHDQGSPERIGVLLIEAIKKARDSTAPKLKR